MPPLRRKINQRSARILILSFLTHRGRLSFYFIFGPPAGLVQQVCALSAPRTGDAERTVEIKPLSLPSKCSIDALRCSLLPLDRADAARRFIANTRFYSVNGCERKISMLCDYGKNNFQNFFKLGESGNSFIRDI